MSFVDNFIGFFSPEKKLQRTKARMTQDLLTKKRAYAGATKSRRGEGWQSNGLSATAEIAVALTTLRDRSRELVRNNAYASRAMQVIQVNVVGKGIRPAITMPTEAAEEEVKKVWKSWGETTQCDFDGIHDFYGIQALAMRSIAESGEVLLRKRRVRREKGKLSVKIQVLEADFLVTDHTLVKSKSKAGNTVIQGIEFDAKGQKVAYHLYESHPGNLGVDTDLSSSTFKTVRVPADEIRHVFKIDRPGQLRGVPWLAPAMLRLKDFDDYEQAQLIRQKMAACYMAFVKDTEIAELDEDETELLSSFEPGQIEFLPPGKDIVLADPPQINENYADYTRVMLQAVATAIGVSYEALTGNLKDINFSSSRMGWLEFQRNIETWRTIIMYLQVNDPLFEWFVEAAELEGLNTKGLEKTWTAPRREMIDPAKEVPALVDAVNNGMKTLSEVIRENGKNPEDHFKEMAAEKDTLDRLGIVIQTENNQNQVDQSQDSGKVSETTDSK